jgi:hypothetical protein
VVRQGWAGVRFARLPGVAPIGCGPPVGGQPGPTNLGGCQPGATQAVQLDVGRLVQPVERARAEKGRISGRGDQAEAAEGMPEEADDGRTGGGSGRSGVRRLSSVKGRGGGELGDALEVEAALEVVGDTTHACQGEEASCVMEDRVGRRRGSNHLDKSPGVC